MGRRTRGLLAIAMTLFLWAGSDMKADGTDCIDGVNEQALDHVMDTLFALPRIDDPGRPLLFSFRILPLGSMALVCRASQPSTGDYRLHFTLPDQINIRRQIEWVETKFPAAEPAEIAERIRTIECTVSSRECPEVTTLVMALRTAAIDLPDQEPASAKRGYRFELTSPEIEVSLGVSTDDGLRDVPLVCWAESIRRLSPCGNRQDFMPDFLPPTGSKRPDSPFIKAIQDHDAGAVHTALDKGTDINRTDRQGNPPLMIAAESGDPTMVSLLVEQGAAIDQPNTHGVTALMVAAKAGRQSMVQLLLDHGADVNRVDSRFRNALFFAAMSANGGVCRLLVNAGIRLDQRDAVGNTALAYLPDHSSNPEYDFETCIAWLLQRGGRRVTTGNLLLGSVGRRSYKTVQMLLDLGVNVNYHSAEGVTALQLAAEGGDEDMVRLLLKNHADINETGYYGLTPLMSAVESNHEAITALLLNNGADVNARDWDGWNAVMYASRFNNPDILRMVLAVRDEVNDRDDFGYTPLMIAARCDRNQLRRMSRETTGEEETAEIPCRPVEIVDILLAHGADPTLTVQRGVNRGKTALDFAREGGAEEIARLLAGR